MVSFHGHYIGKVTIYSAHSYLLALACAINLTDPEASEHVCISKTSNKLKGRLRAKGGSWGLALLACGLRWEP
jgi:hypothetical protein